MATWFPFFLISAVMIALIILSFIFISANKISDARVFIAIAITDLFIMATMCTFALIIGFGTGIFRLTETFIRSLSIATVGEVASMLGIVLTWYFKGQNAANLDSQAGITKGAVI